MSLYLFKKNSQKEQYAEVIIYRVDETDNDNRVVCFVKHPFFFTQTVNSDNRRHLSGNINFFEPILVGVNVSKNSQDNFKLLDKYLHDSDSVKLEGWEVLDPDCDYAKNRLYPFLQKKLMYYNGSEYDNPNVPMEESARLKSEAKEGVGNLYEDIRKII